MENILKALLAMQEAVSHVQKDLTIETRKGKYSVLSHTKVLNSVRDLMIQHGLVLIPEAIQEFTREAGVTSMVINYRLYHTSGESMVMSSAGQGADPYDKGAGMASTYADKYMMLRLFRLLSGDDPDQSGTDQIQEKMSAVSMVEDYGNRLTNYIKNEFKMKKITQERYDQLINRIHMLMSEKDQMALREMVEKAHLLNEGE